MSVGVFLANDRCEGSVTSIARSDIGCRLSEAYMKYVFASVAGICGAVLFGIVATWLLVQVVLLWRMSQAHGKAVSSSFR